MPASLGRLTRQKPVCQQTQIVMIIANKPDNKIKGIISADFPHRKATVKMANPNPDRGSNQSTVLCLSNHLNFNADTKLRTY